MNKISKKIVSLITMAAFVLTLVPAAAFAADDSTYKVENTDTGVLTVTVDLADDVTLNTAKVNVDFLDAKGASIASSLDATVDVTTTGSATANPSSVSALADKGVTATAQQVVFTFTGLEAGDYNVVAGLDADGGGSLDFTNIEAAKAVSVAETADVKYSVYGVIENAAAADDAVDVDEELTTGFVVYDAYHHATSDAFDKVWIWAEEGNELSNFFVLGDGSTKDVNYNAYYVTDASEATNPVVTFTKAGTYTLHAGVGEYLAQAMDNELQGTSTITVSDKVTAAAELKDVKATVRNGETNALIGTQNITFKSNVGKLDLTAANLSDFAYDGIDTITISGTLVDEDGHAVIGKKITATTNKDSVVEMEDNAATDVTDQYGNFDITFVMQGQSNATVTLVDEDNNISYTIQITAAKATAESIDRTLTGGNILAGTDTKYAASVYTKTPVNFSDAVQFEITDTEEEAMTSVVPGYKLEIRDRAKNSTLEEDDLALVWDSAAGAYTLAYTGNYTADGSTYKTDLTEGKYEVRVALVDSEDNATVTFNAVKFGKVQDTVLDITARDYDQSPANPNEEVMSVDDTITLGQQITVTAKYVDGNGIKVPANNVSFNFNGKAVSDWSKWNNVFATQRDIPANESLIGTTVKVVAFNTANKQLVEKTLTVADSYTDKSLEFSSDSGAISKDNKVNVTVVDANGKTQQVEGYMTAWVADQSNEDAKISVDVNKNGVHDVQNGKGSLTVYADQESTADIVVVVKAGTEAYYGTLEYTFGAEDALANRTVVMTIDSTEYVVNNKIITGDAAPYIDSNWRTMVPIRALAESFDAEVIWNQDDSTVTINFDGDTQIVMTVGETAYTVDGAEATMDTEPVNAGDRVYVPVRFAAEGLGFSVLPLYNEAGLTASVVFQK